MSKTGEKIGYIRDESIQAKEQNIDLRDLYISRFDSSEIDYLEKICDMLNNLIEDKSYVVEIGTGCGLITYPLINNSKK